MATCPVCGTSSRTDPEAMVLEPTGRLMAKPPGTFSMAGAQMKLAAMSGVRLTCRCGWSIEGYIEGEHFLGYPETQVFPDAQP